MNSDVIICSGDSFTEGAELGADIIIPGYTSHVYSWTDAPIPAEAKKRFELLGNQVHRLRSKDPSAYIKYIAECKSRAWPGYLQQITGTNTINVGCGAISNQEIAARAVDAFDKFRDKKVTVILMLSSPVRLGCPKTADTFFDFDYRSYLPGHISNLPKDEKAYVEYAYANYSDYNLLWDSYAHVKACATLLKEQGANVIILDSMLWRIFGRSPQMVTLTRSLDIKLDMSQYSDGYVLSGLHFTEETHKKFAQLLLPYLQD